MVRARKLTGGRVKTKTIRGVALGCAFAAVVAYGVRAENHSEIEIVDGTSIPASLTGASGDAVKGRDVAIDRKRGNCLACHKLPIPEQPFHGEVGPDLAGVADRFDEGELRLRIVDSKLLNPDTIMPAFYRADGLHRVAEKFQGKTILSPEQVEDVLAYLMTLKE